MTGQTALLLAAGVGSALGLAALVLVLAWRTLAACLLAAVALAAPSSNVSGPVACLNVSLCVHGSGGSPPHPPMAQ